MNGCIKWNIVYLFSTDKYELVSSMVYYNMNRIAFPHNDGLVRTRKPTRNSITEEEINKSLAALGLASWCDLEPGRGIAYIRFCYTNRAII